MWLWHQRSLTLLPRLLGFNWQRRWPMGKEREEEGGWVFSHRLWPGLMGSLGGLGSLSLSLVLYRKQEKVITVARHRTNIFCYPHVRAVERLQEHLVRHKRRMTCRRKEIWRVLLFYLMCKCLSLKCVVFYMFVYIYIYTFGRPDFYPNQLTVHLRQWLSNWGWGGWGWLPEGSWDGARGLWFYDIL